MAQQYGLRLLLLIYIFLYSLICTMRIRTGGPYIMKINLSEQLEDILLGKKKKNLLLK